MTTAVVPITTAVGHGVHHACVAQRHHPARRAHHVAHHQRKHQQDHEQALVPALRARQEIRHRKAQHQRQHGAQPGHPQGREEDVAVVRVAEELGVVLEREGGLHQVRRIEMVEAVARQMEDGDQDDHQHHQRRRKGQPRPQPAAGPPVVYRGRHRGSYCVKATQSSGSKHA
ncbi:hypothetical protein G6F22_016421 [Rhizopus arrhizus]|nr:hypothetical protein G6F22_016421 [Rhizopus arrhizus]